MHNFLTSSLFSGSQGNMIITIVYVLVIFGAMYFVFIRPQKNKNKKEEEMRNSLQIGDEITTIGGIMGRIVSIKEDTDSIVIETGVERSKIRLKRWSIASRDNVQEDSTNKQ